MKKIRDKRVVMKFSDIEQFTKSGDYEVNIRLNHLEKTLKEYDEDYGLELNPDFQRGHVWSEEQQRAYVEFFIKGGKTARIIYFKAIVLCMAVASSNILPYI